ncbi:MAG: copper oxidase [Acidobacteria bacterium]|nr:copper oxidase [Acidobacteriota bacterium]MBI3427141.1 copper oxidase [Acidobacteriota bacterium]
MNRRNFLRRTSMLGASLVAANQAQAQQQTKPPEQQHDHSQHGAQHGGQTPAKPAAPKGQNQVDALNERRPYLPVITPDLPKLPYTLDNGVKVFRLVAEPVRTEFLRASKWSEARLVDAWGYNGSVPGPTIEVQEGDRVRIIFTNNLPEPTAPHWHGLELPFNMDGGPGLSQNPIMPGESFTYEFMLHQNGTFFYHSHMPMQEMLGMIGMFIIHPKVPHEPRVDKDFAFVLQGWAILPNNTVPNTLAMEFNWLTMNGKSGPDTTPMIVKQGERVRMRFVNLSMDHHPIHMHGHQFYVTGTEGGRAPASTWFPHNTAIVGVAQARDVEFVAQFEGDWMVHCHLPHHMMNQMVSMVGPMAAIGAHVGHALQTGKEMEAGMGIVSKGGALGEDMKPSLGRATGVPGEYATSNAIAQAAAVYTCPMHPEVKSDKPGECPKCGMKLVEVKAPSQRGRRVPGYPQDMWMTMDEEVARPETSWLPVGWTGSMMGMMSLVRVLPPEKYERMLALIKAGKYEPGAKLPGGTSGQHQHPG